MFNVQGSELIIILLLALVVLGPEKLPEAMRRAGRAYAELKKMASGFQQEFNSVLEEPMREARETADLLRDSADFTKLSDGERGEKPKSGLMGDARDFTAVDPEQIVTHEIPFSGPAGSSPPADGFESLPDPGSTDQADAGAPPTKDPFGSAQSSAAPRTAPDAADGDEADDPAESS